MLLPSIDLKEGKVVQLQQGRDEKLRIAEAPEKFAEKFSAFREVQVIDLDAAKRIGSNLETVKKICSVVNANAGGGIDSVEKAKVLIAAGAKKVIIGSAANVKFLKELGSAIGKEKIIVALDSWKGEVVVKGWQEKTGQDYLKKAKEFEKLCSAFLFTCVEKEGLMKGIDFEAVQKLRKATKNRIIAAGGIASLEEARKLEKAGVDCALGMSLYTGKIKLSDILADELDFEKGNGLLPAIAQDWKTNEVLMLAYMNRESLRQTLREGKASYWSRSRNKFWVKGETSGNFQIVKEVRFDCDNDAILLKVEQVGNVACHTGKRSCFFKKAEELK